MGDVPYHSCQYPSVATDVAMNKSAASAKPNGCNRGPSSNATVHLGRAFRHRVAVRAILPLMVAARSLPSRLGSLPEQRILINGVRWKDYVILREALDTPGLRMTYLEGSLEIMSPSPAHEAAKKSVARLVETYAFLLRIPLNGYGSTTFRREAKERGAEPDECWMYGRPLEEGGFPDVVLEVIEASPLLDKLAVYDGFSVPEVWIFEDGAFALHRRRKKGGYERVTKSSFMPDLDFERIAGLAKIVDQQQALEELERSLREQRAANKPFTPKKRRAVRRS